MKLPVDTCGWIEWITNGELTDSYSKYLKNMSHILVPTLIQYELYKWLCPESNENTATEIIGVTEQCRVIPLSSELALSAAEISAHYKLAMADAIVYAASQFHQAKLITSDKYFQHLPNVEYLAKKVLN